MVREPVAPARPNADGMSGLDVPKADSARIEVAEFFAGIGLMAQGLDDAAFRISWANDIEPAKRDLYVENRPSEAGAFHLGDVREVRGRHLPSGVELATASFPCIDLSLAGNRSGLAGPQSGMFWEFARVIKEVPARRRPRVLLLENVHGFANSRAGQDVRDALAEMRQLGYSCDIFAINARHFVPQSRPRMFIVGIRGDLPKGAHIGLPPRSDVRPEWVRAIYEASPDLSLHHVELPELPRGPQDLRGVIEPLAATDSRWWGRERVKAFVESLRPIHAERLGSLAASGTTSFRTAYRRTRAGSATWEIRSDGIAGCLRTTGGGSSKQALVEAGNGAVRIRWMTPREYARLMGAAEFKTSARTENQALFGFGDAVVVDVISWIADHYLVPTLRPTAPE
jgi:DNA (cytosine-5)-methyltransferase 1